MEENLLKYFFNENLNTYQDVKPINIENGIISNLANYGSYVSSMITNDGNYFIRYGGRPLDGGYNAIEVYNNDSIRAGQPLLNFNNLKIYGHIFTIRDLKQDEDGRFYGVGYYAGTGSTDEYYLVLFNNFIQDGYCQIRKFYTNAQMGLPTGAVVRNIAKKEGSADYYLRDDTRIFHYKIDIVQGNTLETYNYTTSSSISSGAGYTKLDTIGDKVIKTSIISNEAGDVSCAKLVIDTSEEIKNSYTEVEVYYLPVGGNVQFAFNVRNFKYYIGYFEPTSGRTLLTFEVIDLNGNVKAFVPAGSFDWTQTATASFTDNYITFKQGDTLKLFYYDYDKIEEFYSGTFNAGLNQIQVLQEYDLVNIVGLSGRDGVTYSMNVYSVGYSSAPYMNKNFLIPQYLNLYSANNNTSLIYSRDVVNKFLAGNQLTTTFNIPNYLLNNTNINREVIYGQTNLAITDNVKTYTKNRFESLYLTYIYGIQIIDNTNGNNLLNIAGSNRLANSVWNVLDDTNIACLKARVTFEDGLQSILGVELIGIINNQARIEFSTSGNVRKIEYISQDEQTVYSTFRCELAGENRIIQTISIS